MPAKKNILFINPWIYDFTACDFWLKPLGLLYVASLLKKHTRLDLDFIDCLDRGHPLLSKKPKTKPDGRGSFPKEEVPKPEALRNIPRKYSRYGIPVPLFIDELSQIPAPELVLVTCTMTYWYPGVQVIVDLVRKKFGRVPVVLGGVYATLMPDHARRFSGADLIFQGPAERGILTLVKEILGDDSFSEEEYEALDDIPWPCFDVLRNKDTLPVLTSRGCPFRCSFCATPLLYKNFEQRSPSSVLSEIEQDFRLYKARNIVFYDDALLLNKEHHLFPLLEGIIRMNLPLAFHTPNGLHVKEIDAETASLFKKANFESLFLSQESFDRRLLERVCPKVSEDDLEKALAHLENAGFSRARVNVYLLVGLPGQRFSEIKDSILRVRRLRARPRLAYFSPLPGTVEWKNLVERGCLTDDADPLVHNKLTFPYIVGSVSPDDFRALNDLMNNLGATKDAVLDV